VIDEVTRTLVDLLGSAAEGPGPTTVQARSLAADVDRATDAVVVFLHSIEESPGRWTVPPTVGGTGATRPAPPGMRLRYLVTYEGEDHLVAQERLAAVGRVVADHPIVAGDALRPALRDHVDSLRITGYDLDRDQQGRLWQALARPFQLSLTIAVELVPR
jgi:hypothetical protein